MKVRLPVSCLCGVVLLPTLAHAQSIEVGPSVATACRGSEGSICGGGSSGLWGGYLSLIAVDKVEIGIWTARLGGDDRSLSLGRFPPDQTEIAITDRSRTFFLGQVIYHFARGERVRPLLGAAFGRFVNASTTICRPVECEQLRPLAVQAGRVRTTHRDLAVVAGLSVNVAERIRIRAGGRFHNFAAESLSTSELFAEAGYRFRR